MNYQETLDWMFNKLPMYQRIGGAAYKADLNNTIELLNLLGNPHHNFKSVHIAGTNGKGSVCRYVYSVLQAAGRCNREGKRSPEESVVTVFSGEDKTPPLFRLNSQVAEKVMDEFADFSDAKAVRRYFEMLIYLKGKEELDKKNIMGLMKKFAFSAIAKEFRLIEQDTQVVYIPWGEQGEKLIGRLRSGERSRALFREAGLYSVALYSDHFRSLVEAGSVQPSGTPGEELWVLTDMTQYDEKTGLSLKADSGQALFG